MLLHILMVATLIRLYHGSGCAARTMDFLVFVYFCLEVLCISGATV